MPNNFTVFHQVPGGPGTGNLAWQFVFWQSPRYPVVLNLGAILAQGKNLEKNLGAKFGVPKAPRSQISERRIEGALTTSQILDTTKVECTVFFSGGWKKHQS